MFFKRDSDFIPRTYSIKGYRRRKPSAIKKFIIYFSSFLMLVAVAALVVLSVEHII